MHGQDGCPFGRARQKGYVRTLAFCPWLSSHESPKSSKTLPIECYWTQFSTDSDRSKGQHCLSMVLVNDFIDWFHSKWLATIWSSAQKMPRRILSSRPNPSVVQIASKDLAGPSEGTTEIIALIYVMLGKLIIPDLMLKSPPIIDPSRTSVDLTKRNDLRGC